MTAKNGMYTTSVDFESYVDKFTKDLIPDEKIAELFGSLETFEDSDDLLIKDVTFVVTERCNLACTYCYETHKTSNRMSKEVAKKAVDTLFDQERIKDYYEIRKCPAVILNFIGGEPLLEIDLIDYIVEYFKYRAIALDHPWQYNYMIGMATNGTLYRSKKVQRFIKRNPNRISMQISVDGNKELHDACRVYRNGMGSYDVVEKSIRQWVKDFGEDAATKATIAPENLQFLPESIAHLAEELQIHGIYSNFVYDKGWKISDSRLGYQQLKKVADWLLEYGRQKVNFVAFFDESLEVRNTDDKNFCGGNGQMIAFSTEGNISPCIRYFKYSLERREEQVIGDVDAGITPMKDNKWLKDLKAATRLSQAPPKCRECPLNSGCGGCTAYNYDYTGTPNIKSTFMCKMHRARHLANIYYWNKTYGLHNVGRTFAFNVPLTWAMEIIDEDEMWMLYDLAETTTLDDLVREYVTKEMVANDVS